MNTEQKYDSLKKILEPLGRILIAYSGGVDSTFLLKAALDCLGSENVLACIGISPSLGQSQLHQALEFARAIGANVRSVFTAKATCTEFSRISRRKKALNT